MSVLILALSLLALLGHAALWIGLVNRVHATGAPRWLVKALSLFGYGTLVLAPLVFAFVWWRSSQPLLDWLTGVHAGPMRWYAMVCWVLAAIVITFWAHRVSLTSMPIAVHENRSTSIDVAGTPSRRRFRKTKSKCSR